MNPTEILAPHSDDAERAVLGSILIHPPTLTAVARFLKPSDFYITRNGWIFEAILTIQRRGEDIDYLTVVEVLRERGQLDDVGVAYIVQIINDTPTHIHAETYGRYVERASVSRRLLDACTDIGQVALNDRLELDDKIHQAREILNGAVNVRRRRRVVSLHEQAARNYDRTEARYQSDQRGIPGLTTGFATMDTLLGGLQAGLYVTLGRAKMGKTALKLSICLNAARHLRDTGSSARILYLTLEETVEALTQRLEVMTSGIMTQKLRMSAFNDDGSDWDRYTAAHGELMGLPIDFLDVRGCTDTDLADEIALYTEDHELALIGLDYLQLVRGSRTGRHGYGGDKRNIEIGDVAYGIADIAATYHVPILASAQCKQDVFGRGDKLPTEYDLQGSDGGVQACTAMISFFRPSVYDRDKSASEVEMAIVANRTGINGPVNAAWNGNLMMYYPKEKM